MKYGTLIIRHFLWGRPAYSNGSAPLLKRFAGLEAKIEKVLPKKLKPLWNHEAGLKSIFFWAPLWKWVLVLAGVADYSRPADKLSPRQAFALAGTGFIWARWSLVIIPKNWNLFSVNVFLGLTGCMQLLRIFLYHQSLKHSRLHSCPIEQSGGADIKKHPQGFGKPGFTEIIHSLPPASAPATKMILAPGVTSQHAVSTESGVKTMAKGMNQKIDETL